MTDAEQRDHWRAVKHEKLDVFRAVVPSLPTISLISYLCDPTPLAKLLDWRTPPASIAERFDRAIDEQFADVLGGAVTAIADEIDRRMPVPA